MKKLIFLVLIMLLTTISKAQITSTSLGLKGKIKEITISSYAYIEKFGEVEKGTIFSTQQALFDVKGYLTIKRRKNDEQYEGDSANEADQARIRSLRTYEYLLFEDGRFKEINEYEEGEWEEKKTLVFKTKFKYDESGKFINKRVYNTDGTQVNVSTNLEMPILDISIDGPGDPDQIMTSSNLYPDIPRDYDLDQDDINSINGLTKILESKIEKTDQFGNWIKMQKYKDGELTYGIERKIVYY
jgi:hypothetical protein